MRKVPTTNRREYYLNKEEMMKKLLFILLIIALPSFADNLLTKVIPLTYISTTTAEHAVRPLLRPGESISHSGNQLIVHASSKNISTVESVLQQLDIPPVTFNIFVHQDQADWLDQDSDDVQYGTSSQSTASDSQSVQVLSGSSAFISMGSNVPVVSSVGGGRWNRGVSYDRAQATQGIFVEPQLQGSQVRLKVRRKNDQINHTNAQEIDQQNVDTTTIIPLDKWVKLGSSGLADNSSNKSDDVSYTAGANYPQKGTLFIKISIVK